MRENGGLAETLGELVGHAFCQPPGIDEHQRGAMRKNQLRDAIVDFAPHLVRGYCAEFVPRNFNANVELSSMAAVDDPDVAVWLHESCDFFQWTNSCRQTDALRYAA